MSIEDNTLNYSQEDAQFVNSLVKAIMGIPLANISEDKQEPIAEKCFSIYKNYIEGYFASNFDQKDLIRIKNFETDTFDKFPDLKPKFQEAYTSFIEFLSK